MLQSFDRPLLTLWMDEIHFAPPKKPQNDVIPCKNQQTMVSDGVLGGAKWILSTVGMVMGFGIGLTCDARASPYMDPSKPPSGLWELTRPGSRLI